MPNESNIYNRKKNYRSIIPKLIIGLSNKLNTSGTMQSILKQMTVIKQELVLIFFSQPKKYHSSHKHCCIVVSIMPLCLH